VNPTLEIPSGGPLFEGHLPGRPILAGVAQLALVAARLDRGALCAIPFARLRQAVLPGDRLEIVARAAAPDRVRVELRRDARVVTNAELVFGAPAPGAAAAPASAASAAPETPPIESLLPHRPPMLFVRRVLAVSDEGLACAARIPAACALVADGVAPAIVGLEAAAQGAALWEAVRRTRAGGEGGARFGYLVSLRDVVLHAVSIPAEAEFSARVTLAAVALPMTWYRIEVVRGAQIVLRGAIGTYLTSERARSESP
jgi:predicted hotdog family 3-hydroxylacyl-ACP dehydratase